ncbi:hypothetical protein QM012_003465 [Aureobasidium pullulans]|uniref:Aminoglycoside phosphotransferase domain-containing protein n=1 Tax=Aureobasidium pullulans TaxID=5580 RepID=A0ABR0T9T4_AURPU
MNDDEIYFAKYPAVKERYLEELCNRIDASKLCSHASTLRGGIPCQVELNMRELQTMMGGQNCHAIILFDDQVKWLARFRLTWTSSPPPHVRDYVLQSEVATLAYLHAHTAVPVPAIYDWRRESDPDNPLGVGYIFMQKLEGKPVVWGDMNPAQKTKVMEQLVATFVELEKHPFKKIGSLAFFETTAVGFDIQHLASPGAFRAGAQQSLGPFSSPQEQYHSLLIHSKELMRNGEMQTHLPLELYTSLEYRLHMLDRVWKDVAPTDQFYLKHPDDKGDHILVNQSFEIVGITDWEWTQTVSKAEAFCSPCMMWPVAEFYNGDNELSPDEIQFADMFKQRGRDDLALCIMQGRKVQRFQWLLGPEASLTEREDMLNLLEGLRDALDAKQEWVRCEQKVLQELEADGSLAFVGQMDLKTASSE